MRAVHLVRRRDLFGHGSLSFDGMFMLRAVVLADLMCVRVLEKSTSYVMLSCTAKQESSYRGLRGTRLVMPGSRRALSMGGGSRHQLLYRVPSRGGFLRLERVRCRRCVGQVERMVGRRGDIRITRARQGRR